MAQTLALGDALLGLDGARHDREGERRSGDVAAVSEGHAQCLVRVGVRVRDGGGGQPQRGPRAGDAQCLRPRAPRRDCDLERAVAAVEHAEARPARQPAGAVRQREGLSGLGAARHAEQLAAARAPVAEAVVQLRVEGEPSADGPRARGEQRRVEQARGTGRRRAGAHVDVEAAAAEGQRLAAYRHTQMVCPRHASHVSVTGPAWRPLPV